MLSLSLLLLLLLLLVLLLLSRRVYFRSLPHPADRRVAADNNRNGKKGRKKERQKFRGASRGTREERTNGRDEIEMAKRNIDETREEK